MARRETEMGELKRYIVVKVREIIHATNDRKEAIAVAKRESGGTFSFVDVFDCLTLKNIYEWSY